MSTHALSLERAIEFLRGYPLPARKIIAERIQKASAAEYRASRQKSVNARWAQVRAREEAARAKAREEAAA